MWTQLRHFQVKRRGNIRESIKSPKRSSNSSHHRIVLEKTPLNLVKILNVVKRTGDLLKDPPTDSLCVAVSCLPFLVYVLCVSNVTSPFSNDYYKDYYCSLSWILVTQLLFRAQNVAPSQKHKRARHCFSTNIPAKVNKLLNGEQTVWYLIFDADLPQNRKIIWLF